MTPAEQLKEIVQKLIDKMDSGEKIKWFKPWKNTFPANFETNRNYSGINVWILWSIAQERNYKTNSWLSFQQVTKRGGKILQGEKATPVFFFKPIQIQEEDELTGEMKTKTIPMLKTFNVFNLDQTDLTVTVQEINEIPSVEDFISNIAVGIVEDSFAYYLPSRHVIGMPKRNSFISTEAYYSTLFHEICHSTSKALGRDMTAKFGSPEYAREEVLVETAKTFITTSLKIEDETSTEFEQSAAYIKGWLKGANSKDLFKIFSDAQKIFDYIWSLQGEEAAA